MLSAKRFRFAELALGVIVGTIVGGLVPADAQIIVDPTLPPQLLEGSGVDVVEALRERRASVEERERALAEQERALAIQREELEASLAVFEGEGSGAAAPEVAADGDAAEALVAQAPAPAATTPEPPAGPTPEELEAERAARLDTLARRVQAMNPAAAAAMVTELEPSLAVEVLAAISPRDSGKIMDRLTPTVAASLGARMVGHTGGEQ